MAALKLHLLLGWYHTAYRVPVGIWLAGPRPVRDSERGKEEHRVPEGVRRFGEVWGKWAGEYTRPPRGPQNPEAPHAPINNHIKLGRAGMECIK